VKKGEVLNKKYLVVNPLPAGGKSENAQVTTGGETFFLKKFAAPKYPYDRAKYDPAKLDRQLELCRLFEQRHVDILSRLDQPVVGGGNLVKPTDFFRERGSYYKVYPFVKAESSSTIASEPNEKKLLFVKTLLLSLHELHLKDIVHSDLKPDNVLLERRPAGPVAKLIDFDEAYISGKPPKRVSGDYAYMSPELGRRLAGADEDPAIMTTRSDIFSLGLVIHTTITGALPTVTGPPGESHAEMLDAGGSIELAPISGFPTEFSDLLRETFAADPVRRPNIGQLLQSLGVSVAGGRLPPPAPRPARAAPQVTVHMGRRQPSK
jgi:eukaryotic-like serine/threonine-protein kinase